MDTVAWLNERDEALEASGLMPGVERLRAEDVTFDIEENGGGDYRLVVYRVEADDDDTYVWLTYVGHDVNRWAVGTYRAVDHDLVHLLEFDELDDVVAYLRLYQKALKVIVQTG